MANFEKINEMIELIEVSELPEGVSFNDFSIAFYKEVKFLPLSKYLRSIGKTKRLPKIMNMRKAGEVLVDTFADPAAESYVKRKSKEGRVPDLDYRCIMLLRRIDVKDNWDKIFRFFKGSETISEINSTTRPELLPQEVENLEKYIKKELRMEDDELEHFLALYRKILGNKALLRSINKLTK